jgi:hypothetical protein
MRLGRVALGAAAARGMHWYKYIPQLYFVYILHGSDRGRSCSHTAPCLRGLHCTMRMNGLRTAGRGLVSLHTPVQQPKTCTLNGWQYGQETGLQQIGAEDVVPKTQPSGTVSQHRTWDNNDAAH